MFLHCWRVNDSVPMTGLCFSHYISTHLLPTQVSVLMPHREKSSVVTNSETKLHCKYSKVAQPCNVNRSEHVVKTEKSIYFLRNKKKQPSRATINSRYMQCPIQSLKHEQEDKTKRIYFQQKCPHWCLTERRALWSQTPREKCLANTGR